MASMTEDWGSAPRATAPSGMTGARPTRSTAPTLAPRSGAAAATAARPTDQQHRGDERGGEAVDDTCVNAQTHGGGSSGWRATPSRKAA